MSNVQFNAAVSNMGVKFQRLVVTGEQMYATSLRDFGDTAYDVHWFQASATNPNGTWDVAKIQQVIRAMPQNQKFMILVTYPLYMMPSPADTGSGVNLNQVLLPSDYGAFASLCAQLVQIVSPIRNDIYWEIINEEDFAYMDFGTSPANTAGALQMAQIYNQCALAMKAVDPTIIVGGPAVGYWQANFGNQAAFIEHTVSNLDFYSQHPYIETNGTAGFSDSNQTIYAKARGMLAPMQQTVSMLNSASPNRHIPLFLDEYNINPTWNPSSEPRMLTNVGAVADAIENIEAIRANVDNMVAFDAYMDGFSHFDQNYKLRPNGYCQRLLNSFFVGNINQATSSDETQVIGLACTNANGRNLMLVNQNSTNTSVALSLGISGNYLVNQYVIDGAAYNNGAGPNMTSSATSSSALSNGKIVLPPDSVTVFQVTSTPVSVSPAPPPSPPPPPPPPPPPTGHGLTGHGLTGHGLTGHGLTEHGITEHGITEHGITGHGLTGHGLTGHALTGHGLAEHSDSNAAKSLPPSSHVE
jgi:hypothetical protein